MIRGGGRRTMAESAGEAEILARLTGWAEGRANIRALLFTGSRATGRERVDALSDYDPILVVSNFRHFCRNKTWLEEFGPVLVHFGGNYQMHGVRYCNRMV